MSDELLQQILRNQELAGEERKTQGEILIEMRTVILGPTNQPEAGLLASVSRLKSRVGRLEKMFMGLFTVGGASGGATAYWDSIKAFIPGMGGGH